MNYMVKNNETVYIFIYFCSHCDLQKFSEISKEQNIEKCMSSSVKCIQILEKKKLIKLKITFTQKSEKPSYASKMNVKNNYIQKV